MTDPKPRRDNPEARYSVITGDVAMTLGNAGLRTYEAIDRITFGSSTAWTTVAEILTYTPKLNDKSARAGIRGPSLGDTSR